MSAITTLTLHATAGSSARSAVGETNIMGSLVAPIQSSEVYRGVDEWTFRIGSGTPFGQAALREGYFSDRETLLLTLASGDPIYLRVVKADTATHGDDVVVRAWPYWTNLDRRKIRVSRDPAGYADLTLAIPDQPADDVFTEFFSHNLPPPFAAGTIHSSLENATVSLEANNEDHLTVLWKFTEALAEANGGYPADFKERWDSGTCYIDIVPWIGASADEISNSYTADPDSRLIEGPDGTNGKNRLSNRISPETGDSFNRIVPTAGPADGLVTIAQALWPVTSASYDGGGDRTTITLSDTPFQSPADFTTETHYFGNDSVGFFEILSVPDENQVVVDGDASSINGARGRVALDGDGAELAYLQTSEASGSGVNESSVSFGVAPYENILKEISVSENFSTWITDPESSSPNAEVPQGLGYVSGGGYPVVTRYSAATYPAYVRRGPFGCHVEAGADEVVAIGGGVLSLSPTDDRPYHSLSVNLTVLTGTVRVELVDANGARHPEGTQRADAVSKQYSAIQIAGPEAASGAATIQFTAVGNTSATYVLDAIAVTNSAYAYDYSAEMGPRALWKLALKHLREQGGARKSFATEFIDTSVYQVGPEPVEKGSWVRIKDLWDLDDQEYDLDETARAIEVLKTWSTTGAPATRRARLSNPRPSVASRLISSASSSAVEVSPYQGSFSDRFESIFTRNVERDAVATTAASISAGDVDSIVITALANIRYGTLLEIRTNDKENPVSFFLLESVAEGDTERRVSVSALEPTYTSGYEGNPAHVTNQDSVVVPRAIGTGVGVYLPIIALQNKLLQVFDSFSVTQTKQEISDVLTTIGEIGVRVVGEVSALTGLARGPRVKVRKNTQAYIESPSGKIQFVTISADVDAGADEIPIYAETLNLRVGDLVKIDPLMLYAQQRVEPGEVYSVVKEGRKSRGFMAIQTPLTVAGAPYTKIPILSGTIGKAIDDNAIFKIIDHKGESYPIVADGAHDGSEDGITIDPAFTPPYDIIDGSVSYADDESYSRQRQTEETLTFVVGGVDPESVNLASLEISVGDNTSLIEANTAIFTANGLSAETNITSSVSTNTTDIGTNASAITSLGSTLTINGISGATNITGRVDANAFDIATNVTALTSISTTLSNNGMTALTDFSQSITDNGDAITSIDTIVTANGLTNLTNITSRVDTVGAQVVVVVDGGGSLSTLSLESGATGSIANIAADQIVLNGDTTVEGTFSVGTVNIANDAVTAAKIDVGDLFGATITLTGSISSNNYSAGTAGWSIGASSAEFNDVTIRGSLDGATGSFSGSLSAVTGSLGDLTIGGTLTMGAGGEITDSGANYSITAGGIDMGAGSISLTKSVAGTSYSTYTDIDGNGVTVSVAGFTLQTQQSIISGGDVQAGTVTIIDTSGSTSVLSHLGAGGGLRVDGNVIWHAGNLTTQTVTGARDDPESALANLLSALASSGLITDSTTAT